MRPIGTCYDCGATIWWGPRGTEATHRSTCKAPLTRGHDRLPGHPWCGGAAATPSQPLKGKS